MGEHRLPTGGADPPDRRAELGPGVLDVAGLARLQVAAKYVLDLAHDADLDEVAREVGARDQPITGHVPERALVRTGNAGGGQRVAHPARAGAAALADAGEPGRKRRVVGVDAEADDVDRVAIPGDGQLGAADQRDAGGAGGGAGLGEAADVVVVGQCEHIHAVGGGARDQRRGRQQSVGGRRVAVEVVMRHAAGRADGAP